MKIMCIGSYEVSKIMEVTQAADAVMANLPEGVKVLGRWGLGAPLPGYPLGTGGMLTLVEAETTEALGMFLVPMCLAGLCWFPIPAIDLTGVAETAKMAEEMKH